MIRYGSVCSGIEAASVAWHPLGWKAAWLSEIEPFPCSVLAHHYPTVPNLGDMTRYQEWPDEPIDLLVGGTPCQSFSVAGLRAGLADPRGNLMLTYLAIAARYRPRWLVWENVPGVLSSESHTAPDPCPPPHPLDLGCEGAEVDVEDEYDAEELHGLNSLLAGFSELGYGFSYRVLDAQYVRVDGYPRAVPQRRRRVFVVGYLGDWRRAAAVLFDGQSLRGDPAPRREAGQGLAADVVSSLTASGRGVERTGETRGQDPVIAVSSTGDIAHCLNAGGMGRQDYETETMIAHALRGEGFDASEDGTGRGTPLVPVIAGAICKDSFNGGAGGRPEGAAAGHFLPIAFSSKDHGADAGEVSPTLRSMSHDASHANGGGQVAVAFNPQAGGKQTSLGYDPSAGTVGTLEVNQTPAVAFDMRGREGGAQFEGPHSTANIRAASGGSSRSYVAQTWAVRRLTPTECERLQGFPDGYTAIPHRKKPAADGPRYKALGNSMAVNAMRFIGQRIADVDALPIQVEAAA